MPFAARRWRALLLPVGLFVALTMFIWPAVAHAVDVWSTDEEFTYGFLILPIAAGIVWWRRKEFVRAKRAGSQAGLALVAVAVIATLVSRRLGFNALAGIAVTPLLIGVTVYLWGWGAGRVVAFPASFLLFGLGLYRGLLSSVGFTLQDITARGAGWAGAVIGLNVVRDGLVLHSASTSSTWAFVVAQTCSGMSSLLSLLSLAALWIYATRGPLPGKAAVFLGVAPLVIIANATRVTLVLLVAATFGQDAALGFFHGASSLVLFGMALVGMLTLSQTVGCKFPTFATSS